MAAINATLKVSVDELKRGSQSFGAKAQETKSKSDYLLRVVRDTNSIWQGEAQRAYTDKFNGLSRDMDRIYKMIEEYRADLSDIAVTYEATENRNKDLARNLNSNVVR